MFCMNQLPSIRTEVTSFFQKLFITVARPTYSISICTAAGSWNMPAAGCFPLAVITANTKLSTTINSLNQQISINKSGQ